MILLFYYNFLYSGRRDIEYKSKRMLDFKRIREDMYVCMFWMWVLVCVKGIIVNYNGKIVLNVWLSKEVLNNYLWIWVGNFRG